MSKAEVKNMQKQMSDEYKEQVTNEYGHNKYMYNWKTKPEEIQFPPFEENGKFFEKASGGAFLFFQEKAHISVTFPAKILAMKLLEDDKDKVLYQHREYAILFELDTRDLSEEDKVLLSKSEIENEQRKIEAMRGAYNVLKKIDDHMRDSFYKGPMPKNLTSGNDPKKFVLPQDRQDKTYKGLLFEKTDKLTNTVVPGVYLGYIHLNYIPSEKNYLDFKTEFEEKIKTNPELEELKVPKKPKTLITKVRISPSLQGKVGRSNRDIPYEDLKEFVKLGTCGKITISVQGHSFSNLAYKVKTSIKYIDVLTITDKVSDAYRRDELDDIFIQEDFKKSDDVSTKKLKVESEEDDYGF